MTETRWWKYVEKLIEGDTAQDAARRAGFDKSAFTRWKKGANADPEFVVKLARAYRANVLEALVEAEFITDSEASLRFVPVGKAEILRAAPIVELAEEIIRKAKELPRADPEPQDNVYPLTSLGQAQRVANVDVQALIESDEPYAANISSEPIPEDDHGWDA